VQPFAPLLLDGNLEEEISPDERHFFIITRRHDLALRKNVYRLVLFEVEAIGENYARDRLRFPARVLIETRSSSDSVFEQGIRSARWLNDSTIVFLAEFEDRPAQVFSIDIGTGQIAQLTNHHSPVLGFAIDSRVRVVVYVAREPVDNSHVQGTSFVAGNTSLTRILFPNNLPKQRIIYQHYRSYVEQPDSVRPLGEPFRMGRSPPLISLSPDGRWAITRATARSFEDSVRLADTYTPLRDLLGSYLAYDEDPQSLFTEDDFSFLMQFRVFDVHNARELPWMDVPDGTSIGREWPFAVWMPDGESVVLANTYLPLDGVSASERERRMSHPSLIQYWPAIGRFLRIADMSGSRLSFQGLYAVATAPETVLLKQDGTITRFRRLKNSWTRDNALDAPAGRASRLHGRLRLLESANEPPEIAFEFRDGQYARITDLNPQLRAVDIGRAVPYTWRDTSGREWKGGLLLPSDFEPTRRYPIVIQLGGFDANEFYIDGVRQISSAMAGRAYLREGILVLAEPGNYLQTGEKREELFVHARGLKAAIDQLAATGVVDPDRVGIVGFSARGSVLQHLITYGDIRIRAATLADAAQNSLSTATAYFFGWHKPGMLTVERRLEAKPWGEDTEVWARRDPSLHTDCIEAAVRYEFYNLYVYQGWETYALLRRQGKPVEVVIFPRGLHQLRRPQERLDSLQGNVDWFRFWLKGEEDGDPAKSAQYERWREMKKRAPPARDRARCTMSN
jgi:hypothetical protein